MEIHICMYVCVKKMIELVKTNKIVPTINRTIHALIKYSMINCPNNQKSNDVDGIAPT